MVKIILGIVILIILFFVGFFVGSFAKQYYCYIKNKKNILETELETENINLIKQIKVNKTSNIKLAKKGK